MNPSQPTPGTIDDAQRKAAKIAGLAYLISFATVVAVIFDKLVNLWWFDMPMVIVEIATSFWLLFKGLRPSGVSVPGREAATRA